MLTAGSDVGGRYKVGTAIHTHSAGCVYTATDLRTQQPVALWHFSKQLFDDPQIIEELRSGVRIASELTHRNVVSTFGLGQLDDGSIFVAQDMIQGMSLNELSRAKSRSSKSFSPKGACEVLSHISNALTFAQPKTAHGALTGESIFISHNGMVLVGDFGLAPILRKLNGFPEGPARHFIAPEVLSGERPTEQADVYSMGSLFYLLVSGVPPQTGGSPPLSGLQPSIPSELDTFVSRCMNENPSSRPADARETRSLLLGLVETWSPTAEGEWPFDDTLSLPNDGGKTTAEIAAPDIDIDLGSFVPEPAEPSNQPSEAPVSEEQPRQALTKPVRNATPPTPVAAPMPPAASPAPPAASPVPPAASPAPPMGMSMPSPITAEGDMFDAALDQSGPPAHSPSSPGLVNASNDNQIDLGSLLSTATQSEYQVWMVQKDNLDHGPFSARELGQQIFSGKVTGDELVLNMDTGVRQRVMLWTEFEPIVKKAAEQRRKEQEEVALRKVETVERGFGYASYVIAAGVVVFIGVVVGAYFLYRQVTREDNIDDQEFSDLFTATGQRINTGGGILPMEQSKRGGRRGGRGGRKGGGRGGMSAEEAMGQGVDYGNLSGAMTQLSVGQITSVMNRNVRRLAGCMGGSGGRVNLDIVINGDGSVAGVSVNGPDGSARSCIQSRARGIRFPSFGSPRMRASYYFEVGN